MNGQFDRTIGQRLFGNVVPLATTFQPRCFDGVRLHQPIQFALLAPAAGKVVKPNLAAADVADDGIAPVGQPDSVAGRLAAEESSGFQRWLSQAESTAGGAQGANIADVGLDRDNV